MKRLAAAVTLLVSLPWMSACEPEVGSRRWCEKMDAKPKGDWTLNEGRDYAKHCLFKTGEEDEN